MSQAHSPLASNYPQAYNGYQHRNVLPQPQSPGYAQQSSSFQQSNHHDAQDQLTPAHNAFGASPHSYSSQLRKQIPSYSSSLPATPTAHSPIIPRTSAFMQHSPMPPANSPLSSFPPTSAYHAITHGIQSPASVPPMPHNSAFSQSPHQQSSSRRPLPTPSAVPRPVTQPPPSRRPLPEPHSTPSAPSTPFRHRPSSSVATNHSASAFSTRPLPNPGPRSSKSLDLTRSQSPVGDNQAIPGSLPSHWQRNLPPALPELPEKPSGLPSTLSQLSRVPTSLRPLPSPRKSPTSPSTSPPASPPKAAGFARAVSTEEGSRMRTGSPLRSRSRTLPHALPPPTGALPHRPDSVLAPPSYPAATSGIRSHIRYSPVSSESEDMYENSLLRRPQQQRSLPSTLPERTPSPPSATRSRFIERSPERGPEQVRNNTVAVAPPTRTRRLSLVSRMAEMSMNGASDTANGNRKELPEAPSGTSPSKFLPPMAPLNRSATQPAQPRWPNDLPPLPRAPQSQSEPGENRFGSRQGSPVRYQPPQHPAHQTSPTRSQFPAIPRDGEGSERFPPPPSHPDSPTRRTIPTSNTSRDPSPIRSQIQSQPPNLPPRSNPTSPSRPRFTRQAPEREPALPAPRAQRMIPNLEDAPPPSLRRSPSPLPLRSSDPPPAMVNRRSYHQGMQPLPNINTNSTGSPTKLVSPPAITPSSAGSVFSLSAFPVPPQGHSGNTSSALPSSSGSRMSSSARSQIRHRNVSFPASADEDDDDMGYASGPSITVSGPNTPHTNPSSSPNSRVPQIAVSGMDDEDDSMRMPVISIGGPEDGGEPVSTVSLRKPQQKDLGPLPADLSKGGLHCGGCGGPVIGRAVHTTDASWHPGCLKCTSCRQPLMDLAVCEYEGRPYCSLDYYENFAPRCHHCQTAIADQNYVTLKDEQLGERTYHEQHFFCAECGDPFLPPSSQPRSFTGDGPFEADQGINFIVHNFHAYCEKCHVRLRMPKCKKCKKSLRLDDDQLEFLGNKYCPDCFACKGCDGPFVNDQLFVRDDKPFCRRCYDIIIKSEL